MNRKLQKKKQWVYDSNKTTSTTNDRSTIKSTEKKLFSIWNTNRSTQMENNITFTLFEWMNERKSEQKTIVVWTLNA